MNISEGSRKYKVVKVVEPCGIEPQTSTLPALRSPS